VVASTPPIPSAKIEKELFKLSGMQGLSENNGKKNSKTPKSINSSSIPGSIIIFPIT